MNSFLKNEWPARIQQMAAFVICFYLTMDMFVEMVRGDPVKEWIFRGIALVFESSTLSILGKSFMLEHGRFPIRVLAVLMMCVSISMASMSAARAAGAETQAINTAIEVSDEQIDDLVEQRNAFIKKIADLPPTYKSSSVAYQEEVDKLQARIDAARTEKSSSTIVAQKRSGIFDDVAGLLKLKSVNAGIKIRFILFIVIIVLIECVLYVETYFVSLAKRAALGIIEKEPIRERIKAWFERRGKNRYSEEDLSDAVRKTIEKMSSPGAQEDLF